MSLYRAILKVVVPVMLLRNLDLAGDLCKGTRLVITGLGKYVIEGKTLTGIHAGKMAFILRT
jgi:hypothetical protein